MHRALMLKLTFLLAGVLLLFFAGRFIVPGSIYERGWSQEYPDLARGLLQGEPRLVNPPGERHAWVDTAVVLDRHYLPFGPLPAILMLPLVPLFPTAFPLAIFRLPFVVAIGWLVWRLALRHGARPRDAGWTVAAYLGGTVLLPLAIADVTPWTSQIVAHLFLLAALYAHLEKRGAFWVGTLLAAAFLSRSVAVLGVGVFIVLDHLTHIDRPSASSASALQYAAVLKRRSRELMLLAIPLFIAFAVHAGYNFLRFYDPAETGYTLQMQQFPAPNAPILAQIESFKRHGLMHISNIPRNLWYAFLQPPHLRPVFPFFLPNLVSMGLLFTSPVLLYIFAAERKRGLRLAGLSAVVGMLPALAFWASGFNQVGYRYAADILPLLLLLLISAFRNGIPKFAKVLIVLAAFYNLAWVAFFYLISMA